MHLGIWTLKKRKEGAIKTYANCRCRLTIEVYALSLGALGVRLDGALST